MKHENKNSTIASLIFHAVLAIGLIGFKSSHVLIPSRSNGMEVSLISNDEIAPTARAVAQTKTVETIKTQDNPADVNIKQNDAKHPKPQPSKIIQPVVAKNTNPDTLQQKPQKAKPKKQSNQINDLLDQIAPANTSTGKTKAQAANGVNGTADTDNMVNGYADLVIQRVRPFVIIPDGMDSSAKAIVEVTLLPNMQVDHVRLIKSSGNPDYDNNIQDAINRVKVFPPLPNGAEFVDYRKLRLTFRPE